MAAYRSSGDMVSPYVAAGAGAVAGGGAVVVAQTIKTAKSRASWALGIGVALTALSLVSSSDLNAAQTQATSIQSQLQQMTIDQTSATTLGPAVNTLRNQMILLAQNQAYIAYGANWWAFNGAPPAAALASTTASSSVYPAAVQTQLQATNNSTALIVLGIAIVAILALVLF